jgi:outer membrane murein-binding lipoprotein Lpp
MDVQTTKDYLEDLVQQINALEVQFRTLNAVIVQLQMERDNYRDLWMASRD